jgi:hypothetical protein
MEFKGLYLLFENLIIHRLLPKRVINPICGPSGRLLPLSSWLYEFPRSFNELQLCCLIFAMKHFTSFGR